MTIAVKRALSLLDLFTESQPELGLSEAARLSGQDKATVHRMFNTLRETELVEQNSVSKLYRLGPAVLRLARLREANVPMISVVQPMLDALTEKTGETSHFSLYTGNSLLVIAAKESNRPNHVAIRTSEELPIHATASGYAFLAFAAADLAAKAREQPRKAFTEWTLTADQDMQTIINMARQNGYTAVNRTYDEDVYGIAAPVFGPNKTAIGAVALASPSHRMTETQSLLVIAAVKAVALDLTRKLGNEPPSGFPE